MAKKQVVYSGRVVGVNFEPNKSNLQKAVDFFRSLDESELDPKVRLEHEPTNKFDKNAIKVFVGCNNREFPIGHIPKTHNEVMLKLGITNLLAEMTTVNEMEGQVVGFNIQVSTR